MTKVQFVSIEGLIGGGKTTILNRLREQPALLGALLGGITAPEALVDICHDAEVLVVGEPVDNWTNFGGVDLLALYYADQPRHALRFQMVAMQTRLTHLAHEILTKLDQLHEACCFPMPRNLIVVTERSVFSDRDIFAAMLHKADANQSAALDDVDWAIYTRAVALEIEHFDALMRRDGRAYPHTKLENRLVTLYIDVPVEQAMRQIVKRGRPAEVSGKTALTPAYLEKLRAQHETVLSAPSAGTVLKLPVDQVMERLGITF